MFQQNGYFANINIVSPDIVRTPHETNATNCNEHG